MKILHLADYVMPQMGYQEFLLPKWNAKHGHEVHIITSDRYTPVPDYDLTWQHILGNRHIGPCTQSIEGVTIHRLPVTLELKRRVWLSGLHKQIEKIKPDIIFCHGTSSPIAFSLIRVSKKLRIPIIMDNHMAFVAQGQGILAKIYYIFLKKISKLYLNNQVSYFLGMSEESCKFMITQQGIDSKKVQSLDFGIDTEIFSANPQLSEVTRKKYNIPKDALVIMQTGKLSFEKGTHILTEAMLQPMLDNSNLWLVFVGGGNSNYMDECTKSLRAAGLSHRILMIPFAPISKLPALMNMANVCVYPGESSLSCIEASGCNVPVIITDLPWGKAREEIGIGICYETGNPKSLQLQLQRLIRSATLRDELASIARQKVLDLYSYESIAKYVESIMSNAITEYAKT